MQPPYFHQFPHPPPHEQQQHPPQNPQPHRHIKLNFPRFHGGDPTEWLSKAKQYFAYQGIPRANQVSFASYHLTQEANEWWLATAKALGLDPNATDWETFEEELWVRFGANEGKNFHEAHYLISAKQDPFETTKKSSSG
ncbi:hypothetical protein Bca4012_027308 [Brassica carinata]|uniref:Retrotransposon gag domain-containing protein n=1 Tax=Brassica carinata TaxID=52824 RepID=A0A8X7VKD5_BRACI|nr:hypothetical protein Bca52824_024305 [Brassica carinata]